MCHSSNIRDHWAQVTMRNRMMISYFEMLRELPRCDPKTWSEQMLLAPVTCSTQGFHKHPICKKRQYLPSPLKWSSIRWSIPVSPLYRWWQWNQEGKLNKQESPYSNPDKWALDSAVLSTCYTTPPKIQFLGKIKWNRCECVSHGTLAPCLRQQAPCLQQTCIESLHILRYVLGIQS